ncbi:M81 family metallopeptidase [Chachezhania sediminis]|uniref:M81 family metallopeptidase n=1 Tax=Chachezhania sediminis TaxID=2599291 RepID=UPI00131C4758|nr:M81 family metallopeptidase [Chachezhania sediminis]
MTEQSPRRIALGGFIHETNTFCPTATRMEDFTVPGEFPGLLRGPEILTGIAGGNYPATGFFDAMHEIEPGWDLIPTVWTAAAPSATVPADVFESICAELIAGVEAALPLDGVYLDLHGAMVSQDYPDAEGEILRRVREVAGPKAAIVVGLDPHGNTSPLMVEMADALVAYRTYPHVDMADTGRRGFDLMRRMVDQGWRPAKAFRQLDFLIPTVFQPSVIEPGATILSRMKDLERPIASMSFFPCFPAADFVDCRPSVLAYADTAADADAAADALADIVNGFEADFDGKLYSPAEAVREAQAIAGQTGRPVAISDSQDNPGGGGNSDTTGMLRALVDADAQDAAIGLIYDPEAARLAHDAGVGATVRLRLGGRSGIAGDAPLEADFVVETVSDGRVLATGPVAGGAWVNLGPSACLRLGGVRIAVASQRVQMLDLSFFRVVGIEPKDQAILVVKSTAHFRADFEPICSAVLMAIAPGAMLADPSALDWKHLAPGLRLKPRGPRFAPAVPA